ncbi:hypothetical protein E2562_013607 [Oryza meyeriana var. granulata]|uniref:F-box protein AT5G49610-like beta-propeller domain-containing protein n=1 Tax=Oryza meyeriana var. granulata TaxID=110450 RepID=A0A6G1C6U4_9ORYZ|nr:hypothetical protein E2562_013607 [Oryza meyeriana var. granulata]
MRRGKKRKRAGKPSCLPAASTSSASASLASLQSVNDDVLEEILVRLPSIASLARAACACARWRALASSSAFLRRFRALHPSLLGHFATDADDELVIPTFHPSRAQFDGCSDAAVRGSDFFLTHVDANAGWRIQDCRHGRVLLANERDLLVYDPLSRRGVPIRRPRWDDPSSHFTHCLLAGDDDGDDRPDSFRVVSVEHYGEGAARAAVFSSGTGAWRYGRWDYRVINPKRPSECSYFPGMQAAGRVYWKHRDTTKLQVFDAGAMRFSYVRLPEGVHPRSKYAVGEAEDGGCCLVCLAEAPHGAVFKVWRLMIGKGSSSASWSSWKWELERRLLACEVIGKVKYPPLRHVCSVVAGVVLISFQNHAGPHRHVAFRLSNMQVCAVKAPRFGENRNANLQDLAILTRGEVTVSKDDTVILDGAGDKKAIEERAEQLRSAIEQSTSDYDKEKLQERLAKLSGGVAILKNEDHLNDKAKQEVTTEEDGNKNTKERESENNANMHEKSASGEDKQSVAEKSASGEGKRSLSEKGEKAVGKEVKTTRSQKGDSAKHEVVDKELLQVDDLRSDDDPNVFLVNDFQDPLQVCYCSFL